MFALVQNAQAAYSGVPASSQALASFENEPGGWLAHETNGRAAADIQSLAVTASVNPDTSAPPDRQFAAFTSALKTVLTTAPALPSEIIGAALGSQAGMAKKTGDNTLFLTALQQAIEDSGNHAALDAFKKALEDQPTDTSGSGSGVGGPVGSGGGGGGGPGSTSNNSSSNYGVPVASQYFPYGGAGSGGVLVSSH